MMAATKAAIEYDGPVYIRLGRLAIESFNDPETYTFELGKGITLLDGDDVAVIATGLCVNEALKACSSLRKRALTLALLIFTQSSLSTEKSSLRLQKKQAESLQLKSIM